jgi:AcrR family transcriptional regulator
LARPRQISDEDLLDIARDVFASGGASASTSVIAERAGCSQAALFKRFGTKDEMLRKAFAIPDPCWIRHVETGPDERPIREQLEEIGASVYAFFQHIVPRVAVLRGAGFTFKDIFQDDPTPPPIRSQRALAAWFRAAMAQGRIRPTDPDVLAFSLLGPFQSRAFWLHMAEPNLLPTPDEVYVTSVLDVFWRGIAPEEPRAT